MKVGIITFQRVNNYGTVLQMYALYQTIKNMGIECEVVDYKRDNVKDVFVWQKNKVLGFLKGQPDKQLYGNFEFAKILLLEVFLNRFAKGKFDAFRSRISFSKSINRENILRGGILDEYDIFVSGSDQVWNCGRINLDATYMLDFVPEGRRKVSYAASFGFKEIPNKYVTEYRAILQNYGKVSIREEDGIKIFKNLTGRDDAKLVLDPSMLLDKNHWAGIARMGAVKKPYVLVYQLGSSKNLIKFAESLAIKHKLRLLVLPHAIGCNVKAQWCLGRGPEEWLGLFLNARYVVTNSFHGTAFSINLNKQFFVEVSQRCSRVAVQSRIYNLLHIFLLEDRLIPEHFESIEEHQINYKKVNEKLDVLREESLGYLRDALK